MKKALRLRQIHQMHHRSFEHLLHLEFQRMYFLEMQFQRLHIHPQGLRDIRLYNLPNPSDVLRHRFRLKQNLDRRLRLLHEIHPYMYFHCHHRHHQLLAFQDNWCRHRQLGSKSRSHCHRFQQELVSNRKLQCLNFGKNRQLHRHHQLN